MRLSLYTKKIQKQNLLLLSKMKRTKDSVFWKFYIMKISEVLSVRAKINLEYVPKCKWTVSETRREISQYIL